MSGSGTRRRAWRYWLPALGLMALIFVLSSQSGLRVSDDAGVDRPFRIGGHLLAFGALGSTVLFALTRGARPSTRDALVAFALTVLYAVTDELHQALVPQRSGRLDDVVVDAIGALIGIGVAWVVLRARARAGEQRRPVTPPAAAPRR